MRDEQAFLWKKIRQGDCYAFDQFYKKYVHQLYQYGLKLHQDHGLIQDSIQDVFITLWENKQKIIFTHSEKHYLFLSFRRLLLYKIQKRKTTSYRSAIEIDFDEFILPSPVQTFLPQRLDQVKQNLHLLSKREREAIYLKYFENLDYQEVASVMSLKVHAVYKLVSKGIKKLRVAVKKM